MYLAPLPGFDDMAVYTVKVGLINFKHFDLLFLHVIGIKRRISAAGHGALSHRFQLHESQNEGVTTLMGLDKRSQNQ
jgi:hypothetical protein